MAAQNKPQQSNADDYQTVVQINIYRYFDGQFEYLLLKRIDDDDDFWLPVTLPIPPHGTLEETLRRAAREQAGLKGFRSVSPETYSYEWYSHGHGGRDLVFAGEVSPQVPIEHDEDLYEKATWFPFKAAIEHLKWDGNKEALRRLDKRLRGEYDEHPGQFQAIANSNQPKQTNGSKDTTAIAPPPGTFEPPSKGHRQQRLPDQPADSANHHDDDDSHNIAEYMLKL